MKTSLDFDIEMFPAEILLPFFWFVEVSKQAIVDRMDCLINKISENCFDMQE